MAAVKDFEELAIYEELYLECRMLSGGIMNIIKEIKSSNLVGAKYKV